MADNPEKMNRRDFLGLTTRAAIFGGAMSMLHIQTAYAEQTVNCPIFTFHKTGGGSRG